MKILIDNIYAHIEYEENQQFIKYFENKINEYINPLDPNRFRNISFRRHIWDGRVPLYDDKNKRLRVGLLYKLQQLIQQVTKENPNLRVSYVDLRESPIKPDIDERIKVDRPEGKSTVYLYEAEDNPRSYQYVSIKNAFEEQRYVVNAATNSGKCVPYDTQVLTPEGYVKIGELLKRHGVNVKNPDVREIPVKIPLISGLSHEVEYATVATVNGIRKLKKITLADGNYEVATYNHPIRIFDGQQYCWRKLKDITVGDNVAVYHQGKVKNIAVVSIESVPPELTYDLCMPKTHSFIANGGIINHNTNIGIGIAIEGLKELSPNEKIFFVCESKQIFYQSHANFEAALHQPIGLWGDGKRDIQQVTCVMIGTVARALKDPRKTVKLTGAKNTMIKHFAEDYVPKFKDVPNVKQAIKSYIRTHKPKYSYDETIHETLATMVSDPHMNNDKIHKALDWYVTKFDSLIRSKAQKAFDKYQEALDTIKDVKICIVDECHHSVSNSYQDVFALMENTRMWVGLSGTIPSEKEPVKRSKFEGIFGNKIYKISNKYLIDNEISAKPTIKFISVNSPSNDVLNIKAEQMLHAGGAVIPKNQKDLLLYQSVYRLGITENEYRNNLIANLAHKLRLSKTGTSLIVVNSLEHGDIIKGILEELGEEVYYLKGEDSTEERNKVLAKVRSGEAKILIGTTILDEGMDLPNLKYLIYASAGKSPRQVLQRVGRVLRISPEKKDTVIFDFMDRTHRLLFNQSKTRLKVYREEQFEIQE